MKKNLRLLCLGLAAATFTASFAQAENVTDKLLNADMEKGIVGWNIDFDSHIWKKNTKNQNYRRGYHGMNGTVVENWKSDATSGLTDNTISQTLTGLPNGTYVFGAYIGATIQGTEESNKDAVTGVTLFANEASVAVATDNPDNSAAKWAHSGKFNVAVNVVDGTLNVGLKAEATTANYLIMDNATLYYFGEGVDAAAALDEMAKIDMAATITIADTCFVHKMNVDTLAQLTSAKEAAQAVGGAAAFWQADEDLYWAVYQANKSASDYRSFNNAIVAAEEAAAGEWSSVIEDQLAALNTAIGNAKATYDAATAGRPELDEQKAALREATAIVTLDSCYDVLDELDEYAMSLEASDEIGQYSDEKITQLLDLIGAARTAVDAAYDGEETALRAHHIYDSLYVAIRNILDNPNSVDEFPILLERDAETSLGGYTFIKGTVRNESDVNTYTSQLYRFQYPLTKVRFVVKETGSNGLTGNYVFFTLSSFEMFDENGEEIPLSEEDITSNACHNTLNPGSPDGQGILGLVDDDPSTFFHSTWGAVVNDYHYIEVTLPEGEYNAFSFAMTARGSSHNHQFPATVEITHVSEAISNLQSVVGTAKAYNAYQGTAPGFYNADLSSFYSALEAAEALLEKEEAGEAEIYAAIVALETAMGKVDEMGIVMPATDKKYRFISAGPFFGKQGIHKAITTYSDTTTTNWLWWETASPDSAQQVFSFEPIANDEGKAYYAIKHEATGLYMGNLYNEDGEAYDNAFGLNAEKDTVELQALGYGQFGLVHEGRMMHAGDHNSGNYSTTAGAYGGIYGQKSSLVSWATAAYNASAWYIREVQTLPCATKSISDLKFQSETITLYTGINTLTLTADKDCAFGDLVVYDLLGEVIPTTVSNNGASATVVLDTTVVEAFSFAFTNAEGVATVTVDGAISKLSLLQDAYDAAVAVAPVKGDAVGEFSDLAEYEAAIKAAEALLANGGTDEAILQAVNDLDSAVVHLNVNLPLPDKTYFIISGLPGFKETHGVDVGIYAKNDAPAWSYISTNNPNHLWKFVETAELVDGERAFYLQNVGTETYMGSSDAFSTALTLVAEPTATQPFRIDIHGDGIVTICDSRYSNGNLHLAGHGGGANAYGSIVYWSSTVGTASAMKIVESEKYIKDLVDAIEDIEFVDEYVTPTAKGIFDLFGRRIEAPAATGIYIVDGKKRVIKK